MNRKVVIRWYNTVACGYFKHGEATPKFGNLGKILSDLAAFAHKKKLVDTKLLSDSEVHKTYLAGISESNGIYVITLWNEVSADGKTINSLPGDAEVGVAKAVKSSVGKGNIPGYPTYYIAIPAHNLFGTLRVVDNIPGLDSLRRYIDNFMFASSPQAVVKLNGPDIEVQGYREAAGQPTQKLRPRFTLQVRRDFEQADFIRKNADKVRKVIRVRTLDVVTDGAELALWQKMLGFVGLTAVKPAKDEMRVRHEVDVNSDAKAITDLVDEYEHKVTFQENDFGFIFSGGGSDPHWLSNVIVGGEIEIAVAGTNGVFLASELAAALGAKAGTLIKTAKL